MREIAGCPRVGKGQLSLVVLRVRGLSRVPLGAAADARFSLCHLQLHAPDLRAPVRVPAGEVGVEAAVCFRVDVRESDVSRSPRVRKGCGQEQSPRLPGHATNLNVGARAMLEP